MRLSIAHYIHYTHGYRQIYLATVGPVRYETLLRSRFRHKRDSPRWRNMRASFVKKVRMVSLGSIVAQGAVIDGSSGAIVIVQ